MTKKEIILIKITSFIVVVTLLAATSVITKPRSTFAASTTIEPLTLPTGKYNGHFNGRYEQLTITSIDHEGKFNGTMNLSTHIEGYFDDISGKITFVSGIGSRPSNVETYTGYVSNLIIGDCITDGRIICRGNNEHSCFDASDMADLAGTFVSFAEGNAKRNTFGWSATHEINQTAIPC
jgi:hypothetical protein